MAITPKQTARNNAFLAKVKLAMNKAIFAKTAEIMNAAGEAEARAYVAQMFWPGVDLDEGLASIASAIAIGREES